MEVVKNLPTPKIIKIPQTKKVFKVKPPECNCGIINPRVTFEMRKYGPN
jgi:hypothetical protein